MKKEGQVTLDYFVTLRPSKNVILTEELLYKHLPDMARIKIWPGNTATVGFHRKERALELLKQKKIQVDQNQWIGISPNFNSTRDYEDEIKMETSSDSINAKINISDSFHTLTNVRPGGKYPFKLFIHNLRPMTIELKKVAIQTQYCKMDRFTTTCITTADKLALAFSFEPQTFGHYTVMTFKAMFISFNQQIHIVLRFSGNVVKSHVVHHEIRSPDDINSIISQMGPLGAYQPPEEDNVERKIIRAYIPPERMSKTHFHTNTETHYEEKLPEYPIPDNLQRDIDIQDSFSTLNAWKLKDNYTRLYHNLLWIEEAQQKKNMRKFDLRSTVIRLMTDEDVQRMGGNYEPDVYILKVPGLAEKRPSVLYRDSIYVWIPGTTDVEYEGIVTKVGRDEVLLMFNPRFPQVVNLSKGLFNVRFEGSRMSFRNMHRALDKADPDIIWPTEAPKEIEEKKMKQKKDLVWKDKEVTNNKKQVEAILSVINRLHGHIPYLLFGAFGCGKSRALLELIIQILANESKSKILVCTQSNAAANYFVKQLQHLKTTELFSRNRVEDDVMKYTDYDQEKNVFDFPMGRMRDFRVVVSTSATAATLFGLGMKHHFTHVILDEASQMLEPEALLPISLMSRSSVLVMAGDPKQIGPILHSSSAIHHKLGESIMTRLSTNDIYHSHPQCSIKLVNNYRSHQEILKMLSQQFYNGEPLEAKGPEEKLKFMLNSPVLCNKKYPICFYAVDGINEQKVAQLMRDKERSITGKDIGIITPYSLQAKFLSKLLRVPDIKVGSPEEFQGTERKVIIVSTVRSSKSLVDVDMRHRLGILKDPRKMNSALSRAGNPYILYEDLHWKNFLILCEQKKAIFGSELKTVEEKNIQEHNGIEEKKRAEEEKKKKADEKEKRRQEEQEHQENEDRKKALLDTQMKQQQEENFKKFNSMKSEDVQKSTPTSPMALNHIQEPIRYNPSALSFNPANGGHQQAAVMPDPLFLPYPVYTHLSHLPPVHSPMSHQPPYNPVPRHTTQRLYSKPSPEDFSPSAFTSFGLETEVVPFGGGSVNVPTQ
ncbi:putative RNA helicase SDE3 [Planoprotostelium fungivorum]|uniref:RNA helicase n=1 Tax=Planoprotostelium fungivorum TaxID=1890364 RepID=A0A2P6NE05_9EUKA|nr:putative RNA helicase SDE3 [Planoprotostelium fungivorum]